MVSPVFGFGLFFSIQLVVKAIDLPPLQHVVCSNDKGTYTAGSGYERNLNDFFSSLLYNKSDNGHGFFRSSFGQNVDKVYAIGLCRPDLIPDACRRFLTDSMSLVKQACPIQKEAIIWTDHSMLRYSNRSLDGKLELVPAYNQSVTGNLSSSHVESFNGQLLNFLGRLGSEAAAGGLLEKFAVEKTRVTSINARSISGLVQCSPDLTEEDCSSCLDEGLKQLQNCCYGMDSGRFVSPSCNLRYDLFISNDISNDPAINDPPPPSANATILGGTTVRVQNICMYVCT